MNTGKIADLNSKTDVIDHVFDVAAKHHDLDSMIKLMRRRTEIVKEIVKEGQNYAKSK